MAGRSLISVAAVDTTAHEAEGVVTNILGKRHTLSSDPMATIDTALQAGEEGIADTSGETHTLDSDPHPPASNAGNNAAATSLNPALTSNIPTETSESSTTSLESARSALDIAIAASTAANANSYNLLQGQLKRRGDLAAIRADMTLHKSHIAILARRAQGIVDATAVPPASSATTSSAALTLAPLQIFVKASPNANAAAFAAFEPMMRAGLIYIDHLVQEREVQDELVKGQKVWEEAADEVERCRGVLEGARRRVEQLERGIEQGGEEKRKKKGKGKKVIREKNREGRF